MKEFWNTMTATWWGILILCLVCAAVWILLSALLYHQFFKRFYDIVLSFIAIIVLSPLLLMLTIVGAIAMKGNPFFVQKRPGRRKKLSKRECARRGVPYGTYGEERILRLLKFRTMTNEKDSNGTLLPDEKRLNKYGKFLRSTSLDELPSILNIFCGSLSIVGPRPLLVKYLPFYSERERHRHDVRPGLTGLAQVNGRNYLSWDQIFEYDLHYVEYCSFLLDLKIFFLTIYKVLRREGITAKTEGSGVDGNGMFVYDTFDKEREKQIQIAADRDEIGSYFWDYSVDKLKRPNRIGLPGIQYIEYFSSGRNAIQAICQGINADKKIALLPEYTCGTVIEPFLSEGFKVYFYQVNRDMTIDIEALRNCVEQYEPSVVLVHSYFGFDTLATINDCIEEIKKRGITVIEDITHSQYSTIGHVSADFYVASARKFFAVPDGGYVQTSKEIAFPSKQAVDKRIIDTFFKACGLKHRYIDHIDTNIEKSHFREKFIEYDTMLADNKQIMSMSSYTLKILQNADLSKIESARKGNYSYLYQNIAELSDSITPVFASNVTENITPLYFPIYVANREMRDSLQEICAKHLIYCPIIWPKSPYIEQPSIEADYIYDHILCIPIDQRYDTNDMKRIVGVMKTNLGAQR